MNVLRWLMAWALGVVVAGALGSVIQSQFNLARISGLGESIGLATRLQTTGHDLVHFAPIYLIIVALGFLIALVVAGALVRRLPGHGGWLFPLAGFLAVAAALGLMNAMLPVTVIGAARSVAGFIALCLAGALGGWLHWRTLLAGRPAGSASGAASAD
jgi:hypothetical protein